MKRLLLFVFIISGFMCQSQAVISLSPVYSFTPAGANTPASTVTFSTSVSLKVYIKNKGNTNFSGTIGVVAYRDTTGGVLCDSTTTLCFIMQPNDSVSTTLTFTPSNGPNAFKSGGNGNTIVVWPFIIPGSDDIGDIGDSIKTTVYVNDPNSVFELDKHSFSIYPNPVTQTIYLRNQSSSANKNIVIYDVFGRKVKETTFKEIVDVSELKTGNYWMMIYSEEKSYRISFIKE